MCIFLVPSYQHRIINHCRAFPGCTTVLYGVTVLPIVTASCCQSIYAHEMTHLLPLSPSVSLITFDRHQLSARFRHKPPHCQSVCLASQRSKLCRIHLGEISTRYLTAKRINAALSTPTNISFILAIPQTGSHRGGGRGIAFLPWKTGSPLSCRLQ
ncbi:hypothetical protein DFH94DRAFT_183412 [Russula ochroleuca]|uniref:Uncharacterized protein n=1 Tax=Russula ochroleuca TaxID=152965 RepID=A0A9P5N5E6_9AGAM|nr:hypothetical protein DFH94DRAFT_183412 [Russula ochroleuca]